jgi:hypothetical protein
MQQKINDVDFYNNYDIYLHLKLKVSLLFRAGSGSVPRSLDPDQQHCLTQLFYNKARKKKLHLNLIFTTRYLVLHTGTSFVKKSIASDTSTMGHPNYLCIAVEREVNPKSTFCASLVPGI